MINIDQYKSVCIEFKDEKLAIETSNYVIELFSETLEELQAERQKVTELQQKLNDLKKVSTLI
jgi:hypothetical protein